MGDPAWDALQAKLAALGNGAGAPATGPSASNALGGNFVNGKAPMVYWGAQSAAIQKNTRGGSDSREQAISDLGIKGRAPDSTMTLQNAVADWYNWSDAERSSFGQRLYKLGLVKDPNDYGSVFGMWQNAVQEASNFYTFGNKKVTPWQVVDLVAGAAHGGQSTTHTDTSKSFNIPTVEDAHAATRSLFQSLVGRGPNDEELNRYASMMTTYAQKHPTVTKQTQTRDAQGNTTSSSTSSGGYSQAGVTDMLGDQVRADPEYGAYQAATTYWNALMGAMGGLGGQAPNA